MSKRYEIASFYDDPIDLMCSDCYVHTVKVWEKATEEEVREQFEFEKGIPWYLDGKSVVPETFEEWVELMIRLDYLKVVGEEDGV